MKKEDGTELKDNYEISNKSKENSVKNNFF